MTKAPDLTVERFAGRMPSLHGRMPYFLLRRW